MKVKVYSLTVEIAKSVSSSVYSAAVQRGMSAADAAAFARVVKDDFRDNWHDKIESRIDSKGQARAVKVLEERHPHLLEHEIALLRRDRSELLMALAEATGRSMTELHRLYCGAAEAEEVAA